MQVRALRGRVVTPGHIIDDGAVVERGAHEELLALGGAYARMWNAARL